MKEEISETLVTFETAKLAKECGCDLRVVPFYNGLQDNKLVISDIIGTANHLSEWYPAPTQSLLQTWLRNRKILVEVFPIDDWTHWGYRITMEDSMAPMFIVKMSAEEEWPTYEAALEIGLQEGLKLIKN